MQYNDCHLPYIFPDKQLVGDTQRKRLSVGDFDLIKVIGRGAFGEVQVVSVRPLPPLWATDPFVINLESSGRYFGH